MIGAACTQRARECGECVLGTSNALLDGVLSVVPTAKIPPEVVVLPAIIESNQEAFAARLLGCVQLDGIVIATRYLANIEFALHRSACLIECTATENPGATCGAPVLLIFFRVTEVSSKKKL